MADPAFRYDTACRMCGHVFKATPFDIPIIGQPPSQKMVEFGQALMQHLAKKHQPELTSVLMAQQGITGMLLLSFFQSQDPELNAMIDNIRADTHRRTRRLWLEDHQLEAIAEQILEKLAIVRKDATTYGISYNRSPVWDEAIVAEITNILRNVRDLVGEELPPASAEERKSALVT